MLPIFVIGLALTVQESPDAKQRRISKLLDQCVVQIHGHRYFISHPRCYQRFPVREMTGIWVVGLETSLFIEHGHGRYSIEEATRIGAELNDETSRDPRVKQILASGKEAFFEVRICGRRATVAGPSGAQSILLERLISIRPIA